MSVNYNEKANRSTGAYAKGLVGLLVLITLYLILMINNEKNPSNFEGKTEQPVTNQVDDNTNVDGTQSSMEIEHEPVNVEALPDVLKTVCGSFDERDRVMILLASLTVISSVIPNVFGYYRNAKLYSNLFLYILGKAGSGKGSMTWTRRLIKQIQQELDNPSINDSNSPRLLEPIIANSNFAFGEEIIIPANSSSAGFVQLLDRNKGKGLLFETEGDTLANIFKADYGNYSDMMRKAFHHEAITQYRKGDGIKVKINEPKLSVLISSTPNQLRRIISDVENGLFSRFMFYSTTPVNEFLDVFANEGASIDEAFEKASHSLLKLTNSLKNFEQVEVALTVEQQKRFLRYFNLAKAQIINLIHSDLDGTVNRMGVSVFRIILILTVLRNSDNLNAKLVCSDADYDMAESLATILLVGADEALKIILPKNTGDELSGSQRGLYQNLSNEFTTADAKRIGAGYGMSDRTIDRFLKSACFEKVKHGTFRKVQE